MLRQSIGWEFVHFGIEGCAPNQFAVDEPVQIETQQWDPEGATWLTTKVHLTGVALSPPSLGPVSPYKVNVLVDNVPEPPSHLKKYLGALSEHPILVDCMPRFGSAEGVGMVVTRMAVEPLQPPTEA